MISTHTLIMTVTTSFSTWSNLILESGPRAWLGLRLSLQYFLCILGWYLSIRGKRKGSLMAINYTPTDASNCAPNMWFDIISYWLGFWFRDYVWWKPWLSQREGKVHFVHVPEISRNCEKLRLKVLAMNKTEFISILLPQLSDDVLDSYVFRSSCDHQRNPAINQFHGSKNWCLEGNHNLSKLIVYPVSTVLLGHFEYS